jgi:regulator of RNase E activity RraA
MPLSQRIDETTPAELAPGVTLRCVHGETMTVSVWTLEQGAEVPPHAIRDVDQVTASGMPVVATGFVPIDTQGAYRVVSEGESCTVRNVAVGASDWIFSDGNGTVVLRADEVEEVLTTAVELERRETDVMAAIDRGERVVELIDGGGQI